MKLITTIEVNEIEVEALICFEKNSDGEINVLYVRDSHSGEFITQDLSDDTYRELNEFYADEMAERSANGRRYAK